MPAFSKAVHKAAISPAKVVTKVDDSQGGGIPAGIRQQAEEVYGHIDQTLGFQTSAPKSFDELKLARDQEKLKGIEIDEALSRTVLSLLSPTEKSQEEDSSATPLIVLGGEPSTESLDSTIITATAPLDPLVFKKSVNLMGFAGESVNQYQSIYPNIPSEGDVPAHLLMEGETNKTMGRETFKLSAPTKGWMDASLDAATKTNLTMEDEEDTHCQTKFA